MAETTPQRKRNAEPHSPPGEVALPELVPLMGEDAVARARQYLDEGRAAIDAAFAAGVPATRVVELRAALYDQLLARLFEAADHEFRYSQGAPDARLTLCAVGGYGRGALSPASDLDLLFLYPYDTGAYVESVSERVLYRLWDLSQEVGSSVRSIDQCIRLARRDLSAYTSLLDHRYLAGDEDLYQEFDYRLFRAVFSRGVRPFLEMREREDESRRERYADTIYLLEPNLKQGEGGLRDLHQALWAARVRFRARGLDDLLHIGAISEREARALRQAHEFLLAVREHLHLVAKRKKDQLTFEVQEQIAQAFGYRDTRKALAVERFMERYYQAARTVRQHVERILERCALPDRRRKPLRGARVGSYFRIFDRSLTVQREDLFRTDPEALMAIFHEAVSRQLPIYPYAKDLIAESVDSIGQALRREGKVAQMFLEVLTTPEDRHGTLAQMHTLGVLGAYLPEFGRLTGKHQHTIYHVYTVDVHTLHAVEHLRLLHRGDLAETEPVLSAVMDEVKRPRTLYLGVLFHDVGKGTGQDHSTIGAKLAAGASQRLGLTPAQVEEVEFLVRHHLTMIRIATRRDIHDPDMIRSFCDTVGSAERLRKLYVLSYVDSVTTGPNVWSRWKALLVHELYQRALESFGGEGKAPYSIAEAAAARRHEAHEALVEHASGEETAGYLASLPDRYFLSVRAADVPRHYGVARRLGEAPFALHKTHFPQRGFSELIVTCRDRPGLLALLTGALAANRMNILSAQIFTRSTGEALDVFYLRDRIGHAVTDVKLWQRFEEHLRGLLTEQLRVEDLVERRRQAGSPLRPIPAVQTKVKVDNEASSSHTVIDVYTEDRTGVLFDITRTLFDLGLTIGLSKVTTDGNRVVDAFYVKGVHGGKIFDPERLDEIQARLLERLGAQSVSDAEG